MTEQSTIHNFLDAEGRLFVWPAKHKHKLLALEYLCSKFTPGQRYSEKEVNAILNQFHTFGDWALLRRYLVDYGFLNRVSNGSAYWRVEEQDRKFSLE